MPKEVTQFKKGESGNPAGKPKGLGHPTLRALIRQAQEDHPQALEWQHPDFGIVKDPLVMAVLQLTSAIQNGEPWAITEALKYGLCKPPSEVKLDQPLHAVTVIMYDNKRNGNNPIPAGGATKLIQSK